MSNGQDFIPFVSPPQTHAKNHVQSVCCVHRGENKEVSNKRSDHNAFMIII